MIRELQFSLVIFATAVLLGCGRKETLEVLSYPAPPEEFDIPADLIDDEAREIWWVYRDHQFTGLRSRRVTIQLDGHSVLDSKLYVPMAEPALLWLPKMRLRDAIYELVVTDHHTGQSMTTNFAASATYQIEIDRAPLKLSIKTTGFFEYL